MRLWDIERVAGDCMRIQSIPAPTGAEHERAAWVAARFRDVGLDEVEVDEAPNVYARLPGREAQRQRHRHRTIVSAHLDTVFPASVDLNVRREGDRLFGPGIGDNSMGLAALVTLAEEAVRSARTAHDLWFVANAAEEGLGDLRGMRVALQRLGGAEAVSNCIVLEGSSSGPWLLTHQALGCRRYRIDVEAPGGHSWGDFGAPSAVHQAIVLCEPITRWTLPPQPRASFNIGTIAGGASVNTIAERATMLLDLRSEDANTLTALCDKAERHFQKAAASAAANVRITWEIVGDRPAGGIAADHPFVQCALAELVALGVTRADIVLNRSSTDANIPLAAGIPAVTLYLAHGGDAHRESEWVDLGRLPLGLEWTWRTMLLAAGGDDGHCADESSG